MSIVTARASPTYSWLASKNYIVHACGTYNTNQLTGMHKYMAGTGKSICGEVQRRMSFSGSPEAALYVNNFSVILMRVSYFSCKNYFHKIMMNVVD